MADNTTLDGNPAPTLPLTGAEILSFIQGTDKSGTTQNIADLAVNVCLPLAGGTLTGALTLAGNPAQALQAATKQYVDTIASGLYVKTPCRVATTANLTATYSNGSSGVGATLTNAGAQAALSIDSIALAVNDRVLIKDQSTQFQNGIYVVSNIGSGSTNWVLTRATDFDNNPNGEVVEGAYTIIEEGTTNATNLFIETGSGPFTVGTTAIVFSAFNSAANINAGDGLQKSGNTLSVNNTVARTTNNLSDLSNVATAQNNFQIAAGIQSGINATDDIIFVNNGGDNITTFDIKGTIYINNQKAAFQPINATFPAMDSTTAAAKSILPGQTIRVVNTSTAYDSGPHAITFKDSSGAGIITVQAGEWCYLTLWANGTAAGSWFAQRQANASARNTTTSDTDSYYYVPVLTNGIKKPGNIVIYADENGSQGEADLTDRQIFQGVASSAPTKTSTPTFDSLTLLSPMNVESGGTGADSLTAHGILVGEGTNSIAAKTLTEGQALFGKTSADPQAGTLVGGVGISVNFDGTNWNFSATGGGNDYEIVTTNTVIVPNTTYYPSSVGDVVFTIPTTFPAGDVFKICGYGAGSGTFRVQLSTGQNLFWGTASATTSTGYIQSLEFGQVIEVICLAANTLFQVTGNVGFNFNIV